MPHLHRVVREELRAVLPRVRERALSRAGRLGEIRDAPRPGSAPDAAAIRMGLALGARATAEQRVGDDADPRHAERRVDRDTRAEVTAASDAVADEARAMMRLPRSAAGQRPLE